MKHLRMARELKTINVMVGLYCVGHHKKSMPGQDNVRGQVLCAECYDLLEYAQKRLEKCPFQERKTACAICPVHCYKPEMREKVRAVMRYAGPRMIYRHPVLAILHIIDSRRKFPG